MRYLSFDIECAMAYQGFTPICNFGYVIYDDNHKLIKKEDIIINPRTQFKLTGRKNQKDVNLHYSNKRYRLAHDFTYYYETIRDLLEHENQIIVNHAVLNDIEFLKNEIKRYKLPTLVFEAYDTAEVYKVINDTKKYVSLNTIKEEFLDDHFEEHKADDDADAAIKFFFKACELENLNPQTLLTKSNITPYNTIQPVLNKEKNHANLLKDIVKSYKDTIPLTNSYKNKSIALSMSLEEDLDTFTQIVISIYQLNGIYTNKVSKADLFIYKKSDRCKRYKSYTQNVDNGKSITALLYEDFKKNTERLIINSFIASYNN